jgi:primosomal protein N' (replication factor Y)
MLDELTLVRVAIPVPLAEGFDYLWTGAGPRPPPGARVRVPFGRGERVGIVIAHADATRLRHDRLKPVAEALDRRAAIGPELLASLKWAARYYHHPIGEVLKHALPGPLSRGRPIDEAGERVWRLTESGEAQPPALIARRARQQAKVLELLSAAETVSDAELKAAGIRADTLRRLAARGWVESCRRRLGRGDATPAAAHETAPELTSAQRAAVRAVMEHGERYGAFLLHGVTGSGKTEVFLSLIARALRAGRQTLLLAPEIGLTPQLVSRLRARFGERLAVLHSGLTDKERFDAWRRAHTGAAQLLVGTRSAVFAPLPAAGLIIVDEEHDPSYKQQHGFRYNARDLAVVRARHLGVPIVLASATPSLESFHNALDGRYRLLSMPERIGSAGTPAIRTIDLNRHATRHGLSTPLLSLMEQHLARRSQVLLFLNRRGFAPALFCPTCQTVESCDRCDARMTVHAKQGRLRCHHCGREKPLTWACETCSSERIGVGAGTQRVTDELKSLFPAKRIARLDRDVAERGGALAAVLADVARGDTDIIVGTQMLTKGHDFPRVTLVGVLNADQGLFGTDFRSGERLAQTIVQVAGRAGRRDAPGEVVIQTHYPGHPLLTRLLNEDYAAFARLALQERRSAAWPPFSYLAEWRAEATRRELVYRFLNRVKSCALQHARRTEVLGPAPDPMERKGGRYRAHLLLQDETRGPLHALIDAVLAELRQWPESRRVRWSLDVDPIEL